MNRTFCRRHTGALFLGLSLFVSRSATAEPSPAEAEFFENKVRPVLVQHCYECHGAKSDKVRGGLVLDSRDGLLKGGNNGPAVVPRNPDASLLIKAVRYTDKHLQMPPKGRKLAAAQVADLEAWVRMGAPDPRTKKTDASGFWARAREHWAFRPVQAPIPPRVENPGWVRTPIDAFVLAELARHGLTPSPPTDKRTLIRRATFDLIGLPPTPEETAAFVRDATADAFAKVVDRLLASPHYGERWGRHWLDVARYSDTKGYVGNESDNRYFYAYTYRDYVIRACNDDMPFDRFITEQLAADQLPGGGDNRALAALGFLTVGKRHLNVQNDILDDRIDVVTRGLLGLTVACARCHDHKYDPVPTRDYYGFYGIFASSTEPAELPVMGSAPPPQEQAAFRKELAARQEALKAYRREKEAVHLATLRRRTGDYLLTAYEVQKLPGKLEQDQRTLERKLDLGVRQRWQDSLRTWASKHDPVFAPWIALAALPEAEWALGARELLANWAAKPDPVRPINPLVLTALSSGPPTSFRQVIERYGQLLAQVDERWQKALAENPRQPPAALSDANEEALRQVLYGPKAPPNLPRDQLDRFFDRPTKHHVIQLQMDINDVIAFHPGSPARALVLQDVPKPQNTHIFLQGDPGKQGAEAPRQFLELLAGDNRKPFPANVSGRLQLAQAIASRDNPLTARVLVNRVWQHHFGAGLVRTPSDFGVRSQPPTHPALLDYLAWRFMEDGWSLKKLHRLIVLSSAYQQGSADDAHAAQVDPVNRWLWKMDRRRLDFETLRDSLLAVSGTLDRTMGGRPVDLTARPLPARRAIYGLVDRLNFPDLLRTFDVPNPDKTISHRPATTIPQQALFFLNDPLVVEQARNLAKRSAAQAAGEDERVRLLYQLLYQREPADQEVRLAREFLAALSAAPGQLAPEPPAEFGWRYGQGEYDPISKRVTRFQPLTRFAGNAWLDGAETAGSGHGVRLTAEGGTTDRAARRAAVRRWIAPQDGLVRVAGSLSRSHGQAGDVRGRIVSSRAGELGSWTAGQAPIATDIERIEVRRGDTLDFVVEGRGERFSWAPHICIIDVPPGEIAGVENEWKAAIDFSGPPQPLNAWEQYAQALLMANEFAYDD